MLNNMNQIYFINKECKNKNHFLCQHQWIGLGFTITCTCNCHKEIYEKNIVLDGPGKSSNTYHRNHLLNLSLETE